MSLKIKQQQEELPALKKDRRWSTIVYRIILCMKEHLLFLFFVLSFFLSHLFYFALWPHTLCMMPCLFYCALQQNNNNTSLFTFSFSLLLPGEKQEIRG